MIKKLVILFMVFTITIASSEYLREIDTYWYEFSTITNYVYALEEYTDHLENKIKTNSIIAVSIKTQQQIVYKSMEEEQKSKLKKRTYIIGGLMFIVGWIANAFFNRQAK